MLDLEISESGYSEKNIDIGYYCTLKTVTPNVG